LSDINFSLEPREFINEVRARYRIDDPGSEMLHDELNSALSLLSEDLYSDDTHFVSELIQNADDNEYANGVVPRLEFRLKPDRLVVVNNEIGFSAKNVWSLCRTGKSTKKGNKSKFTGEKGIGFKSVFTVSDAPEIHSNGYHFRFNRTDKDKLLGFVVPEWRDDSPDSVDGQTSIVLPAPANSRFDASKLHGLDPNLLLFLRQLRHIEIHEPAGVTSFLREEKDGISVLVLSTHPKEGAPKEEQKQYVRTEFSVDMESVIEEKRPKMKATDIVLAFPVSASYEAQPDIEGSKLYAFLPIRQSGFRFSIQADFVLSASRGEIREALPWNIRLRDALAGAFVSSLDAFKRHDLLKNTYFDFIPGKEEVSGNFLRPVRKAIFDQLVLTKCLRSASGTWCLPKELRTAGKRFRELFPSETAKLVFGYDYVHEDQKADKVTLDDLGVQGALVSDVISLFNNHLKWFQEQPKEWKRSLYSLIADSLERYIKAGLLEVPFLPLDDGTSIVPKGQDVYFPLGKGKKYGFEQDLRILDVDLFNFDKDQGPNTTKLLSAAGVLTDDPYDMIVGHILPKHVSGDWKSVSDKSLLGHLRYIKEKCEAYLIGAARHVQSEADALNLLREKLYIGTKEHRDGSWVFNLAKNLYIGSAYRPEFPIEKLLEGVLGEASFVSEEYISKKGKDEAEVAVSWRSFFARLGIRDTPKVIGVQLDWHCTSEMSTLLGSSDANVRLETLRCISRNWHLYADKIEYLASRPGYRGQFVRVETNFIRALRATVVSSSRKTPVALNQAYYPSAEIKAMMGSSVIYVDEDICAQMLDACQVSRTLDAKVLIKRLRQFKADDAGATARAIQKIYGRIEDVFDDEKDLIQKSFKEHSLIRVKGPHGSWRSPDEVCWESSGAYLDSICPPLEGQYKDFSRFFEKLGVKKEIPIQGRIDALEQLSGLEPKEDRRKVALACYERFSRLLKKGSSADGSLPSWIQHFWTRNLFLDQEGRMVQKDNDLFVDDAPQISRHFADASEISFLWVPQTAHSSLQRFLEAAEVPYLSASYSSTFMNVDDGEMDQALTSMVRQFAQYFAQILHARDHDAFEEAHESGTLKALKALEVCVADEVLLEVSLAGVERNVSVEIARNAGRIVYRRGARSVKDKIAAQLCSFLGAKPALEDMFTRILIEGSVASIEEFLDEKQIGQLPEDGLFGNVFYSGPDTNVHAVEDEPNDDVADDVEPQAFPADESQDFVVPDEVPASIGQSDRAVKHEPRLPKDGSTPVGGTPAGKPVVDASNPYDKPEIPKPATGLEHQQHPSEGKNDSAGPKNQSVENPGIDRSFGPGRSSVDADAQKSSDKLDETTQSATGSAGDESAPDNSLAWSKTPNGGRPGFQTPFGSGASHPLGKRKSGASGKRGTRTGHLMSYVLLKDKSIAEESREANSEAALEKRRTGSVAVKFFMENQAARWKSLIEMPELNPGFDVLAVAHDGEEEFIEVKGQTDIWTERGVTLTPRELLEAQKRRGRYWLCVVEYVHDEKRRRLYLFQDPFGLTDQFKFDSGWKAAAIAINDAPLQPEPGRFIDIPSEGHGKIISVTKRGKLFHLHVLLDTGKSKNLLFKPDKMVVSEQ
jgi:hypothetical protein